MGGDHAPEIVVEGASEAKIRYPDIEFIFFGNKKILEVGSLFGFFSSVLKDLGNDVTAFDRYNDFNGALDNFCSDMKNQNINVIHSSEVKEDKDFEKLEKFDVITTHWHPASTLPDEGAYI